MGERVLYSSSPLLKDLAHEVLTRMDGGTIIAVPDEPALALLRDTSGALLYFSMPSYKHAVRRLSEPEREKALRQRHRHSSPNAVNDGMAWLQRQERRCLHLAAQAGSGTVTPAFEQSLQILHRITNEGRFGNVTLDTMLVYVLESEALLMAELSQFGAASEAAARNQFDLAIGKELLVLGRPEYGEHLPGAKPVRGVFVAPRDESLVKSLRSRRQPFIEWQDGLIAAFESRNLERIAGISEKRVTVLYPSSGNFLTDASELTLAQLHREFAERTERNARDSAGAWAEYCNDLRLNTALLREATRQRAAGESPSVAALLTAQIQQEKSMLAAALARHPSLPGSDPAPSLPEADKESLDDMVFLARFCAARGPADLRQRYETLAELKRAQLRRA